MTSVTLAPRISGVDTAATRSANPRAALSVALLAVLAVVPWFLAVVGEGVLYRSTLVAGGAMLLLLAFYAHALTTSVRPGTVRVRQVGSLTFTPRAAVVALPFAISLAGMTTGALAVLALGQPGEEFGRGSRTVWGAAILGLLATAWLVQNLLALRRPAGLGLSSWGLAGVRGGPAVRVPWDWIVEAKAISTSKGTQLGLVLSEGVPLTIHGQYLGSDPALVAAIIEHYRSHPEDEELLAQPAAAVRRAEAASA